MRPSARVLRLLPSHGGAACTRASSGFLLRSATTPPPAPLLSTPNPAPHALPTRSIPQPPRRAFTASARALKKGAKAARDASASASSSKNSNSSGGDAAPTDDPFDLSALESETEKALERLRADLAKLRTGGGGRFNPEVLEALRVQVKSAGAKGGEKGGKGQAGVETVRLGDLAQVVPKGRSVQVLVGEAEHLKPITSTIQSSPLSLTPLPSTPSTPLTILLQIPPPTADSRRAALAAATKALDAAALAVRNARQTQQKKLRAMQVAKSVRPDDLKKAGVAMERLVERVVAEVKRVGEGAKKGLEG